MKLAAALVATLLPFAANAAPEGYFDLAPGITLETGDTWERVPVANGCRTGPLAARRT